MKTTTTNTNFNEIWRKYLAGLVEEKQLKESMAQEAAPYNSIVEGNTAEEQTAESTVLQYTKHSLLKGKVDDLNYDHSETYFTNQLQKELGNLLDGSNFAKKTQHERQKIQDQLSTLNADEYEWKMRAKGFTSENKDILGLFTREYPFFEEKVGAYLHPSDKDLKESQRAHTRFFEYRMKNFVIGMTSVLTRNRMQILEGVHNLSDEDYKRIVRDYIKPKAIFVDLMKVIIKKAHDNLFSQNRSKNTRDFIYLSDTSFVVNKKAVYYEYRRVFALYVYTSVLSYISAEKMIENLDSDLISEKVRNFLYRKYHLYDTEENQWWTLDLSHAVTTCLHYLEKSDIFLKVVNEVVIKKNNPSEKTMYILPTKLEDLTIRHTKFPLVTTPGEVTDEDIDENLKRPLFGENRVSKSNSLKKVLTVAQKKRYSVNTLYTRILDDLLNIKSATSAGSAIAENVSKIELPFMLRHQLFALESELDEYKDLLGVTGFAKNIADDLHTQLLGEGANNVSLFELNKACSLTDFETKTKPAAEYLHLMCRRERLQRKLGHSALMLAKLYTGVHVYITSSYCVRLRLYPNQPLMARTSGAYKHLLCEPTPLKVTLNGFRNLLVCYYTGAGQYLEEFEEFLSKTTLSKKKGMETLLTFFHTHPIDFLVLKDNFLYISLMHTEIINVECTGKTGLMVEIDQKASGCCFLALAFRNKALAEQSNVISKVKSCPYTYCMEKFPEFFKQLDVEYDELAFNFLSTNRKLHKYALMCFAYSQKSIGREEDFIERWYLERKEVLSPETRKVLVVFATEYERFIEFVFPKLTKQIDVLLDLVEIVVRETGEMTIQNLSGEKLHWRSFKYKSVTRKGFDPVTKKHLSYRIDTTELSPNGKEKDDISDHKVKFLSYLIHSIDAAVMHHFILEMREKEGYTINHLHDCVLVHPNYIDPFYEIVRDLYASRKLYDYVFEGVFEEAKRVLSRDSSEAVDFLINRFKEQCDDFEDSLGECCEKHLYQPEH